MSGTPRVEAGFTAAYLRFHDLGAGEAALTSLDTVAADADGSPLAERALGLRVQILASLGRTEQAAQAASSYLVRFPRGGLVAYMRKLAR